MNNRDLSEIKKAFGAEFEKYCERHKVIPEKVKCGAFMLPDVTTLQECVDVKDRYDERTNSQLYKLQTYKPWPHNSIRYGTREPFKVMTKNAFRTAKNMRNDCENQFLRMLHLNVYLYDTPSTLPSRSVNSTPTNYILYTAKSGSEMFEFIMRETVKDTMIRDYQCSIPCISNLLEQFQKRHKKFHYYSALKHLIEMHAAERKLKCEYEVTIEQLQFFLLLVFHKVVPPKLFGNPKNAKRIKTAMLRFLTTPRFESFNLKSIIEKLNIESIEWLKSIKCEMTRWLVIGKFLKWFFSGYLVKILRSQLHLTAPSTDSKERIYIRRTVWCDVQKKFAKKMKSSDTLQTNIECPSWNPPLGVYKLIPKYNSVRPLFITKYDDKEWNDANIVFKFLKQLYATEYDSPSFHSQWKLAMQEQRSSSDKRCYVVSCDVVDAFGSIIQEQLYSIILSLCEKLPEKLKLQYYAMKSKRFMYEGQLCHKQYFSGNNLELALPSGILFASTKHMGHQWIQKTWLLDRIRKYIFHQRVKIRNKVYVIGKGIVQGTMLSPILSEIYYNFMLHREMAEIIKSGVMIRYMDDILYISGSETSAARLLDITKKGIPQYNCRFKESKTQTNIQSDGRDIVNTICFIGYKLNCQTLEIVPEVPKVNVRYLMSFYVRNDITPFKFFKQKMCNITTLKLSRLVLDREINSRSTIIKVLREASLLQARRASALILELFPNVRKEIWKIFKIIKLSNRKIVRHIIRTFLNGGQLHSMVEAYTWNKTTLRILWLSYKDIFMKKKILRMNFVPIFL